MRLGPPNGMPDPIYRAIQNDSYDKGDCDYSCTEILKPFLQIRLQHDHVDEIIEDPWDRLYSLYGQLMHSILERAALPTDYILETRLFLEIGGITLSGQLDTYNIDTKTLADYKFTTVFSYLHAKQSWANQLNILAYLAKMKGWDVKHIESIMVFRDWRMAEGREFERKGKQYPRMVETVAQTLWDTDKAREYIVSKLLQVDHYVKHADMLDIPKCSDTWGGKRCEHYCDVVRWCPFIQAERSVMA